MNTQIKICGITDAKALDAAVACGASHVGFVFFAKSPRNLSIDAAAALAARLPSHVAGVGLFVDPDAGFVDTVRAQVALHALQFHGDESPAFVTQMGRDHGFEIWKAIPVKTSNDLKAADNYRGAVDRILFDAKTPENAALPGGMGVRFDWGMLRGYQATLPWGLAGGLNPGNVAEALRVTGAALVDTSSGVESAPGVKDVDKIAAFCKAVRDS
ncbi:MAG: phosphoribosylanthranilate isomerase [Sphingorhabdus sp.]